MDWNTRGSTELSNTVASDVAVVRVTSTLTVGSVCRAMGLYHVFHCDAMNRAPCSMTGCSSELTAPHVSVLIRHCFRVSEFWTLCFERRKLKSPALCALQ